MSQSLQRLHRISTGVLSLFACVLLAGGLTSCNSSSSSNNESQTAATLALTPSTISLTVGTSAQPASLLLAAPAGAGAATITVAGLPTGVTISPSTLSATPGTALPLTFTAATGATAQTQTITIRSSDGNSVLPLGGEWDAGTPTQLPFGTTFVLYQRNIENLSGDEETVRKAIRETVAEVFDKAYSLRTRIADRVPEEHADAADVPEDEDR